MRTKALSLFASGIAIAASLHTPLARAGGIYVGIGLPVTVAIPMVTTTPGVVTPSGAAVVPVLPPAIVTAADVAVAYDPTVVVGPTFCCNPGWRGYGWHDGWRSPGYGRPPAAAYAHPVARGGRR